MDQTTIPTFDLSDRLAKARKTAGLDQEDIAVLLGCARTTVSNYESGKTRPSFAALSMWAQVTGTSLVWLAGNDYPKVRLDLTRSYEGDDQGISGTGWSHATVIQPSLFDDPSDPVWDAHELDLTSEEVTEPRQLVHAA